MDPGNITHSFFGSALPPIGTVIDDTWIVQSKHGPFDPLKAPQDHLGSGQLQVKIKSFHRGLDVYQHIQHLNSYHLHHYLVLLHN